MKLMITLAAGAAIGYVLGARAGREQYDRLVEQVGRLTDRDAEGGVASMRSTAGEKVSRITGTARRKAHDTIDLVDTKVESATDRFRHRADRAAAPVEAVPGGAVG